jgi:GMP synthase (glutamine-hydrolysing)
LPRPLRVRLVQIRDHPAVLAEERASFAARCGLAVEQVLTMNALTEPVTAAALDGVDALFVGGAGAHSVVETYAWTESLVGLCRLAADRAVPTFGACWGHQFLARAFGGTVVYDPLRAEMGTHAVELTAAGRADALFDGVPDRFEAQMGHHDRVSALPPGAVELARNGVAPYQAFRLAAAPVYGAQFHPELDADAERGRLLAYRAHYPEGGDDTAFQALLDGLRPTPHADGLLRRFLEVYAA